MSRSALSAVSPLLSSFASTAATTLALTCAGALLASPSLCREPATESPAPEAVTSATESSALYSTVGWALPIGCASDGAKAADRALECAALSRVVDQPLRFEGANREVFFLHGVDAAERASLAKGDAVEISGELTWQGKYRALAVESVAPATEAAVDAARSVVPQHAMHQYFLTILQPGEAPEVSKERKAELMRGHFAHISEQAQAGTLFLAGPFGDHEPRTHSGLYLYDVATLEEAEALSLRDPAVASGYFRSTTIPWWGPASLAY